MSNDIDLEHFFELKMKKLSAKDLEAISNAMAPDYKVEIYSLDYGAHSNDVTNMKIRIRKQCEQTIFDA